MAKELIVIRNPRGYYEIGFDQGGVVPTVLSGIYNKMKLAQRAVTDYNKMVEEESNRTKREYRKSQKRSVKNAKDTTTGD